MGSSEQYKEEFLPVPRSTAVPKYETVQVNKRERRIMDSKKDDNEEEHAAFEVTDEVSTSSGKFLGVIHRRYLRSFVGLIHALSSLVALVLGNFFFVQVILRNIDIENMGDTITSALHVSSAFSGVALFFFYNKVQSWQLSTTSMKLITNSLTKCECL